MEKNTKNNIDLTIMFVGFDGYSDIWNDCINLYNKFWPKRPCRTLFINNDKEVSWDGIEVLHAGKDAEWSRKVQLGLQHCSTNYVCLLLEDFFVGSDINNEIINETIELIHKENIRYYKLVNMSRAVKNHDPIYRDYNYLHIIPESDEYGVSLQAAIWKKEYLEELVGKENYNAWVFEFRQVEKSQGKLKTPKPGCVYDERNILNLKHGVVQSKFIPTTVRYFNSIGSPLSIKREVLSYSQYFRIQAISFIKYLLPESARRPVKKMMELFGMKFVSTERNEKK